MIIFGTRGVKSTIDKGQFSCPQCAREEHYKHKKVTNFFTLYFIPLIPLGNAGEYVECQSCYGTFVPRILDYNPNQENQTTDDFQALYEKAMLHSMVLMMLADGVIDDGEMLLTQIIINRYGHNDLTLEELKTYVEIVQRNQEPVDKYLSKVAPSLNEHGKEVIIKSALSIAQADGHVDQSEIAFIKEMAEAMQMSKSHLKGILLDMEHKQGSSS